jgi:archaetidylinositol phosphate synthase
MVNKEDEMRNEIRGAEPPERADAASSAHAARTKTFLLARPEERALRWLAARVPPRVLPDHLTALGVLAAIGIAIAYLLSNDHQWMLWVASGLLVVHWVGDSLDGTLARFRRIERPAYGYYLDHLVDAFATAAICVGLGLSPHMLLATGLAIAVAYLLLSINTYLETSAFGRFDLGYGRIGPTEIRVALIGLNTALALGAGLGTQIAGVDLTVLDAIGLGGAAIMVAALLARAAKNLRVLAEREPAGRVRPAG